MEEGPRWSEHLGTPFHSISAEHTLAMSSEYTMGDIGVRNPLLFSLRDNAFDIFDSNLFLICALKSLCARMPFFDFVLRALSYRIFLFLAI